MTRNPTAARPARPDEVHPSDDMRSADRANGEPSATDDVGDPGDGHATLVTDDPATGCGDELGPSSDQVGPSGDEVGPSKHGEHATLVTDDPECAPSRTPAGEDDPNT